MSIDLVFTEKPEEPSHHQAKGLKTDFLPTSTIKLLPKLPIKLSNLSPLCQGDVGIVNIVVRFGRIARICRSSQKLLWKP